jgi:hypothetical protein
VIGPYTLWVEYVDVSTKTGRITFKTCTDEVTWGCRHADELGILELISLRLNKALIESTSDEFWSYRRPVVRLAKKEELIKQDISVGLWYQVQEIAGEEFDNR